MICFRRCVKKHRFRPLSVERCLSLSRDHGVLQGTTVPWKPTLSLWLLGSLSYQQDLLSGANLLCHMVVKQVEFCYTVLSREYSNNENGSGDMPLPQEKRYTLADALTWDESERIKLIYGDPFMMAPPVRKHQEELMELSAQLHAYLKGKKTQLLLPSAYLSGAAIIRKMWIPWWSRISRLSAIWTSWMISAARAHQIL